MHVNYHGGTLRCGRPHLRLALDGATSEMGLILRDEDVLGRLAAVGQRRLAHRQVDVHLSLAGGRDEREWRVKAANRVKDFLVVLPAIWPNAKTVFLVDGCHWRRVFMRQSRAT